MGLRLRRQLRLLQVALYLFFILVLILFPTYWMALTSLKSQGEIYQAGNPLWIQQPTLENYVAMFTDDLFLAQYRNSLIVSVVSVTVTLVVSTLAAYSMTRLRYPGRNFAGGAIFFAYLVPPSLLFIPMYLMFGSAGLLDTPLVLVLSYLTLTVPFATWMLRGYFQTIPRELEDAALVDGCTRLGALRRVVMPLAAPGITASAIFTFTLSWNHYLYAFVLVNRADRTTLPVGISQLIVGDVILWGQIMAGAVMMSLPVLVIYVFGQRYIVSGMTAGAVKG